MITAFGCGVGEDFDIKKLRYDRIVCMTDADVDGSHIRILMLTFFYRYMRPLMDAGKVYIALPPLYRLQKGKGANIQIAYAWTDEELEAETKKMGKGYTLTRFKGLGEMNADQLWETTMNPETRTLIRVRVEDGALAERRVTTLMGDRVEPRREWIEQNVEFDLDDDGSILETKTVDHANMQFGASKIKQQLRKGKRK